MPGVREGWERGKERERERGTCREREKVSLHRGGGGGKGEREKECALAPPFVFLPLGYSESWASARSAVCSSGILPPILRPSLFIFIELSIPCLSATLHLDSFSLFLTT